MSTRSIQLLREGFPDPPPMDTAVSRAILQAVARGEMGETLRLHRPGAIVAFGPKDRLAAGYAAAVDEADRQGFASIQRLAGGRAAVFHEGTIAFSWATPESAPREGIQARFIELSTIVAEAFRSLGVDARIGEVPGEYCPGEFSVNARGAVKLMGVGQRIVAGAAHVGGVIVVSGSDRVRDVLVPVYRALGLAWEPATAGGLEDEIGPLSWDDAERAVIDAFGSRFSLTPGSVPEGIEAEAARLAPEFAVGARPATSA